MRGLVDYIPSRLNYSPLNLPLTTTGRHMNSPSPGRFPQFSLDLEPLKGLACYCIIIQTICNSAPSTEFFSVSTRLTSGRPGEFARVQKLTHSRLQI